MNDCALDLRGIRAAQLYVTFGGLSDLFGVPGGTVALSNVALDVEGTYMEQVPAKDKRGNPIIFGVRQLDELNVPIPGANNSSRSIRPAHRHQPCVVSHFFRHPGCERACGRRDRADQRLYVSGRHEAQERGNVLHDKSGEFHQGALPRSIPIGRNGGNAGSGINPEAPRFFPIDIRDHGKLSTGIPTGALDANFSFWRTKTRPAEHRHVRAAAKASGRSRSEPETPRREGRGRGSLRAGAPRPFNKRRLWTRSTPFTALHPTSIDTTSLDSGGAVVGTDGNPSSSLDIGSLMSQLITAGASYNANQQASQPT